MLRALLTVWANDRTQSQLEGQTRNKNVFESIAAELADLGGMNIAMQNKDLKFYTAV